MNMTTKLKTQTSRRVLVATFRHEQHLRRAVGQVRRRGARIGDVYSPYAIHGLDEDLGWRPSRLTWACGICGAAGAVFMLAFQFWTNTIDWPLNVGGKPFNSLPAFVPVTFEAMVLCGAIGTVLAFFVTCRLWPGKQATMIEQHVTDDRFVVVIEQADATFDSAAMTDVLEACHAEDVEERAVSPVDQSAAKVAGDRPALRIVNIALAAVFVLLVIAILFGPRHGSSPNYEFLPTMRRSLAIEPQSDMADALAPAPLPGTIARDAQPLDFDATDADAKRAGDLLTNPFSADDLAAMERGRQVFVNFCVACHGPTGDGDGPIPQRGYPPPPPLGAEKSRVLKDGELFHVISYGRNNMPPHRKQLTQQDRWKALLYIRELQRRAAAKERQAVAADESATKSATDAERGSAGDK